jgi:soluble lytic murein transglycosylase-like protein
MKSDLNNTQLSWWPALALGALLACAGLTAQADIYRTVDSVTGTVTYTNIRPQGVSFETVMRDPVPPAAAPQAAIPATRPGTGFRRTGAEFASHIEDAARAYGVEPALIRAVISAESGHNPYARSRAGALGLMQLMPDTAIRYGVTNRLDPVQNIHGGARYLRDLLKMFNNDLHLAIAAYNAGEEAVMRHGRRIPPFRETIQYVPRVMKFYQQYRTI